MHVIMCVYIYHYLHDVHMIICSMFKEFRRYEWEDGGIETPSSWPYLLGSRGNIHEKTFL